MKRFLLYFTIVLTSLSLIAANAEARRLGGGTSIGKQRTMSPQPAPVAPSAAPAAAPGTMPGAAPASAGNRWLGPLAGLALGAGLGALFANMGLGGGGGALLLILLGVMAAMFMLSLFAKRREPAMQYAAAGAPYGHGPEPVPQPEMHSAPAMTASTTASIPADFPVDVFLRSARTTFIRLQAANDRKDLDDIREYTTPEMYAEIAMQMNERGDAPQKTDVLSLDAVLLEVVNEGDYAIASVRYTAQLRENDGAPESVDEIWHVHKNLRDPKAVWLLAGIQQTALH